MNMNMSMSINTSMNTRMNMNMNMRNNNNDNNGSKNFNHSNDVNSNNHYADFMLNQTMEDSLLFSPPLDSQQTQPRSLSPILEENQEQQQQPVSLLMEYLEEDVHPHTSEDLGVDTGEDEDELGTSILAVPEEDNDEEEVPDAKEHDNCISAALYSSLKEEEEEDDDDDDGSMSHIKYNSNRIRKNVNDDCEENDTRKDCDLESDDHPTVYVHSQLVSSTASSNFNEKVSRRRSSSISSGSITTDNVIYDPDLIHRKDHLENDINLRNHMEDPSKCASDLCDNDGDDNEDHNRTDDEANDNPHGITFHPTFQPLSPSTDDDNENKNDKTVKACHNHIRHNNEDVAIMSSSSKLQTKLSSTSKLSCSSTITANATTPKRRMSSSTSDFSSAQKAINSTSNAFLSRLQAAGKQRLLQVNRVRKLQCEQQRKRVNEKEKEEEAVKTVPAQRSTNKPRPSTTSAISKQMKVESVSIYRPFTARKLPPYAKSGYGQVGVPRVAKMESTIPKSPKLGPHNQSMAIAKMRQKMKAAAAIAATQESKLQPSNTNEINRKGKPTLLSLKSNPYKLFYARPIPKGVLDSINDEGIKRDFPRGSKIRQSLPAHRNDIGVSQRQSVSYKSGSHVGRNLRPFQIKAGSEASRERERIQQERIRKEEVEVKRLASSFRAKRLPLSSVYVSKDDDLISSPTTSKHHLKNGSSSASYSRNISPLVGLNILNSNDRHSNEIDSRNQLRRRRWTSFEVHTESNHGFISSALATENLSKKSTPAPPASSSPALSLHSSMRARGRAAFEKRKIFMEKQREAQKENNRAELRQRLSLERDSLRESIR